MTISLSGQYPVWVWYQLGIEFYTQKFYEEAITCLKKVDKDHNSKDVIRKLIFANFNSGKYEEAETLCIELKEISNTDVVANEVLLRIYEDSGRAQQVTEILEWYLKSGEETALDHFRLLGIKYYHSINDKLHLRRLLLEISKPSSYTLLQQFMIARMYLDCEEIDRGLEIAYNARIENFEKNEAHEFYVHSLIGRPEEPEIDMFPVSVSNDNAVELLDRAGNMTIYFITDDFRVQGQNILRPLNPLAKLLINKSIGETITLENSVGLGNMLIVKSIISKHVFAFRESLKLLETKFAGQTKMVFFQGAADPDEFKEYLVKFSTVDNRRRKELLRLYNSGSLTIGALARFSGKNIVELWLAMMSEQSIGIQCYERDESSDLNWVILGDHPVVIDATSLLTIFGLLGKYELLQSLPFKYYIAQATFNEISQYHRNLEVPHPKMFIGLENGKLKKSVPSRPEIDEQKVWLQKLIEWCKQYAIIQTPKKAIEITDESSDIEEIIGKAAYDSLKLANELGAVILSDDAKLKSFSLGEFNLRSFSSYQMVTQNARANTITPRDFSDISSILVRSNYVYIPLSGDDLWTLFEESDFQMHTPFSRGVRGLQILNPQYAASTILTFAKKMYLNIAVPATRDNILQIILRMTKTRTDFNEMRDELLRLIEREFHLLPKQGADFRQLILTV